MNDKLIEEINMSYKLIIKQKVMLNQIGDGSATLWKWLNVVAQT